MLALGGSTVVHHASCMTDAEEEQADLAHVVQWLINFGTFDALHRMLAARHCVSQMASPVVFDLVSVATVEVWHHRSYVCMHTYSI